MNRHVPHPNAKEVTKQQDFNKQQQQLREFVYTKNNSQSKALSADSMIEDLLSKKETFQKRTSETKQNQEGVLPSWLSKTPPPLFERVWQGVQTAGGLADTPLLSSVLLTSSLPTETLGYIWSLANRTVPGALTQTEVFLVLALVGLAQAGYVVSNLAALHQVPQAPIPTLDLTLLPNCQTQVYPNTLSVTNLPDQMPFNWPSPETVNPGYSGQIGVSYVSSGPMISPNFISEQTNTSSLPMKFSDDTTGNESLPPKNNNVSSSLKMDPGVVTKTNTDIKRSEIHSFSFPKLNDSPSHVTNDKPEDSDPFDDEFTEFQSADFSSISQSQEVQNSSIIDEDEFSNFQNASPNYNGDDLSVLVIGGKPAPSAQQLWVTDKHSSSYKQDFCYKTEDERMKNEGMFKNSSELMINDKIALEKQPNSDERKLSTKMNYEAFQEIDEDKYSVFHNPLPDEEDKQNVISNNALDTMQLETKSIFQHSLFQDSDLFNSDIQTSNQLTNLNSTHLNNGVSENKVDDDDEYSNFQNFPYTFSESNGVNSSENIDKYDVFRTIVFENTSQENELQTTKTNNVEHFPQLQPFESGMDEYKKGNHFTVMNNDSAETKSVDSIHFGDIQEPAVTSGNNSNVDSLFSSLVISERKNETEMNSEYTPEICPVEDKYKALRLLEPPANDEGDDFGDFLGAELPNSGNDPKNSKDLTSIQIRCLEACLHLLKDGVSKMSQCSTPEVVTEVLNDERANAYLDCLLEVHRVSERIISQLNCDLCVSLIAELHETWDNLAPYFKHSEHTHMVETVGAVCGVCRSNTGPSPVTFGAQSFHTPCANLYLHCVEPVLPNIVSALVQ